ncbi:hypothetical protein [Avibacterium paragallinarum]|uniref:hypothetical protein n=1 Tax=Avibacterium paragallinarum TaxID=728 RepID=UPI001A92EAF9|nr:hypothetical protein [Avibacterium paragallinarum]
MYFIDTNILSEIRKIKQGKANLGLIRWLSSINEAQIYTNVVVIMELERGILAKERKDPPRLERIGSRIEIFVERGTPEGNASGI